MKCEYCDKEGFKNNKGLSVHRRYNRECYNKWLEKEKEKENKRTKVKCLLCGKKLRNISNTHLKKHNITQKQYKILFPEASLFSEGLLEEQKQKRENTIQQRYTKEEIKYLKGKKSVASREKKYGITNSEISKKINKICREKDPNKYDKMYKKQGLKIKKFHKEMSDGKRKEFNDKKLKKRKQTNFKKYGIDFPQKLEVTKKRIKKTKKEKYGDENYVNVEKCKKTLFKNYGKYSNFFPHFSITSQELFQSIENNLKNIKCYFAINGEKDKSNEFQVLIGKKFVRFLDFYIPDFKKWIEFDEKHHKCNKILKKDGIREKQIFKKIKSIKLLRITEQEFLADKNGTLKKCLNFIKD